MSSVTGLTRGWPRPLISRAQAWLTRHLHGEATGAVYFAPAATRPEVVLAPATHFYRRRQVLVASDLGMLRGPVTGEIRLPELLKWSGDEAAAKFNLDVPEQRPALYVTILREAHAASELGEWLNGDWLADLWPRLVLPPPVRAAWEQQHPVLRDARTAYQLRSVS